MRGMSYRNPYFMGGCVRRQKIFHKEYILPENMYISY